MIDPISVNCVSKQAKESWINHINKILKANRFPSVGSSPQQVRDQTNNCCDNNSSSACDEEFNSSSIEFLIPKLPIGSLNNNESNEATNTKLINTQPPPQALLNASNLNKRSLDDKFNEFSKKWRFGLFETNSTSSSSNSTSIISSETENWSLDGGSLIFNASASAGPLRKVKSFDFITERLSKQAKHNNHTNYLTRTRSLTFKTKFKGFSSSNDNNNQVKTFHVNSSNCNHNNNNKLVKKKKSNSKRRGIFTRQNAFDFDDGDIEFISDENQNFRRINLHVLRH